MKREACLLFMVPLFLLYKMSSILISVRGIPLIYLDLFGLFNENANGLALAEKKSL
jgi:hypothetical protein